jgi:hypothetical protein
MCDEHFTIHGRGTGSGVGQRLVRKSDPMTGRVNYDPERGA